MIDKHHKQCVRILKFRNAVFERPVELEVKAQYQGPTRR